MKSRKRTLKAWALIGPGGKLGREKDWGFFYAFASSDEALWHLTEKHKYRAVPCTITYSLPSSKKGKHR